MNADEMIEVHLAIDAALQRFGTRSLVAGSEVVDFLLDLRLIAGRAPSLADRELVPAGG
jgi:hypothetical protein